jgi:hypothetical protein
VTKTKQLGGRSKDADKIRILKTILPSCKLGNWSEVKDLSQGKAEALQNALLAKQQEFLAEHGDTKAALVGLGLSEDELKLSRSVFPYLPRFQKRECRVNLAGASPPTVAAADEVINSSNATTTVKADSKLEPARTLQGGNTTLKKLTSGDKHPGTNDKEELTVFYGRYDWTSHPKPEPPDLRKFLKPAATVVGTSTLKWKRLSTSQQVETLNGFYGRE